MAGNANFRTGSAESDILTHPDISGCIVKQITNLSDYIRFGGVCRSWREAARRDRFATVRRQPPGLISTSRSLSNSYRFLPISHGGDRSVDRDLHGGGSSVDRNLHGGGRSVDRNLHGGAYPHHRLRWIRNYSSIHALSPDYGWLLSTNNHRLLLNPVTGVKIPLPNASTQGTASISKASMSLSASTHALGQACYVLVLHDGPVMSFCERGDSDWRYVESRSEAICRDSIYFEGKFYVLMSNGDVRAIDEDQFGAASPGTRCVARLDLPGLGLSEESDLEDENGGMSLKLVEIGGDLMVLVHNPKRKRMFEIFKLDLITKDWISVEESFGDYALFIGDGQAFALAMDDVPAVNESYRCVMANHIYFAANVVEKSFVYSFGDSDVRALCCPQHLTNTLEQAALWFSPLPW